MSNDNKEAKKEELLEKQEARQLTEEELEQVTGGLAPLQRVVAPALDIHFKFHNNPPDL